jgi:hypothetical protein
MFATFASLRRPQPRQNAEIPFGAAADAREIHIRENRVMKCKANAEPNGGAAIARRGGGFVLPD